MNTSVRTMTPIEFINLSPLDLNPGISKVEIKVMYTGDNRNMSSMSKDVATDLAKSLRGAPIVGVFKENKQDFGDHGEEVTINSEGIFFRDLTRPYGFVPTDAKAWFAEYTDVDANGVQTNHLYLMVEGYLWTGQYEECKRVLTEGNNQSMKLNDNLEGHWVENHNSNLEFFIVDKGVIENLCILGDDVEPCFEGSSITKPMISLGFSKDGAIFGKTLYSMLQELNDTIKGGQSMEDNVIAVEVAEQQAEAPEVNFEAVETEAPVVEEAAPAVEESFEVTPENSFKKEEDKEEDKEDECSDDSDEKDSESKDKDDEENKKKFELLEEAYEELQNKYSLLEKSYNELLEFKATVEDKQKDELINSFYMLSDEDKKDVVDNKTSYSLEEIESKLSVICFRKKINFSDSKEETPITAFNLNGATVQDEDNVPDFIKACRETQKNR